MRKRDNSREENRAIEAMNTISKFCKSKKACSECIFSNGKIFSCVFARDNPTMWSKIYDEYVENLNAGGK